MSAFLYRLGRNCARHPFRVLAGCHSFTPQ